MALTIKQVVETVRKVNPISPSEALVACKLPLKCVGLGAFRAVFHILGTPLVIKFPFGDPNIASDYEHDCTIEHATYEYHVYQIITKSRKRLYQPLKAHMPQIYHFDWNTGVTLAHKYRMLPETKGAKARKELSYKFQKALKLSDYGDPDITNGGNVGVDRWGRLKIVDLGMLISGVS